MLDTENNKSHTFLSAVLFVFLPQHFFSALLPAFRVVPAVSPLLQLWVSSLKPDYTQTNRFYSPLWLKVRPSSCSGWSIKAKGPEVEWSYFQLYSTSEVPCQSFGDWRVFEDCIHCHSKGFEIISENAHYSAGFRFLQTGGHKGMSNSAEASWDVLNDRAFGFQEAKQWRTFPKPVKGR